MVDKAVNLPGIDISIYIFHLTGGCPTGTFYNDSSTDCQMCPIGTYQDEEFQFECIPCIEGYTTKTTGSKSLDNCTSK